MPELPHDVGDARTPQFRLGLFHFPHHTFVPLHYFDHNATAPMLPVARDAWLAAAERFVGNASSRHRAGQRADHAIEGARETFAKSLGCHALDLIWTSGATESANTVMRHLAVTAPSDQLVWVSAIEHPCVLASAEHYFGERFVQIPVTADGVVNLDWISEHLPKQKPDALFLLAANNETGVLQPWETVHELCRDHGVPFVCDATQWIGRLPATGLGACDWLLGSAHKSGGPKGVGFLKCPPNQKLHPLLLGGGQQEHRRAGTENVPAILGWEAAWKWCEQQIANGAHKERAEWRAAFIQQVSDATGVSVATSAAPCLWNTASLELPAPDCRQLWTVKLDRAGFAVSSGSACASGDEQPSHVLRAMGRTNDQIRRTIRVSSGWETTREDWRALAEAIAEIWRNWPVEEPGAAPRAN